MAKGKKKVVGKPKTGDQQDSFTADGIASTNVEVPEQTEEESEGQSEAEANSRPSISTHTASYELDHAVLAEKLANAEALIESLKSQLASKDEEIAKLKEQLSTRTAVPLFDKGKLEDMQKLQERMVLLKREQAEADAARDNAWKQLKSVVSEIAKLSSVERFQGSAKSN